MYRLFPLIFLLLQDASVLQCDQSDIFISQIKTKFQLIIKSRKNEYLAVCFPDASVPGPESSSVLYFPVADNSGFLHVHDQAADEEAERTEKLPGKPAKG